MFYVPFLYAQTATFAAARHKQDPEWSSWALPGCKGTRTPAGGRASSPVSAWKVIIPLHCVRSFPPFLEGDPTARPPCKMSFCCRKLYLVPKPFGGFAALRDIYSWRQTPTALAGSSWNCTGRGRIRPVPAAGERALGRASHLAARIGPKTPGPLHCCGREGVGC